MKKIIALAGVVLFSASAFALNAVAPAEKDCEAGKAAFEQRVNSLSKDSFIVQYILINLADPVIDWTDEQLAPLAQCYYTYRVKGTPMTQFVRARADIFRQNVLGEMRKVGSGIEQQVLEEDISSVKEAYDKLQAELLEFASRVEKLGKKAEFEELAARGSDRDIMEYVFENMVNPLSQLPQTQAKAKAKEYRGYKVKGKPLSEFVREQAQFFDMNAEIKLEVFADQVDSK